MSRRTAYIVIAVAAWVLGLCWALSSPIGSSPDDDYHMTSIFCQGGENGLCRDLDGAGPAIDLEVPADVVRGRCIAFEPEQSGACPGWPVDGTATNDHHNAKGGYPPTFYAFMGLFAGEDVARSVLIIRLVAMTTALACLGLAAWASPILRDSQLVAWSVFAIPLGMFIFPSTNPSAWGVAGVAAMWPAGYALLQASSRRQMILATTAVVFAGLLSTARGDTAALAAGVLGLVVLAYARSKGQWLAVALSAVAIGTLGLVFLSSGQSDSLTEGLEGTDAGSGIWLLWGNLLGLPGIWAGSFGLNWGLGWLDTEMPALSWFPACLAAGGLALLGVERIRLQRGLVMLGLAGVLAVYPLLILQLSSAQVGSQFQPRYILPILMALGGVLLAPLDTPRLGLSATQRWILTICTTTAVCFAMHAQLRRYASGTDVTSPNLNAGSDWSYLPSIGPNAIWVVATVVSVVLYALVLGLITRPRQPAGTTDNEFAGASTTADPVPDVQATTTASSEHREGNA